MEVLLNGAEGRLVIVDQVDLVHGEDDVAHAQECRDVEVATRLLDDAVAGVDKQHHCLGGGHAGDRVARVLHMARGIRQDKGALVRRKVAVGHIDRDALLALGTQAVDKQAQIHAVETAVRRGAFHGFYLVRQHRLGVIKKAANEGGLTVVHRTRRAQAQRLAGGEAFDE